MSAEVKTGETKDNTQKKKELEDNISKKSIKGTDESLKCFEELKELNKTLNEIKSVKDISKIYKTIFPKFEDHSFTKIRNAVLKSREMRGGAKTKKYNTPWEEAKRDSEPGSVYILKIENLREKLRQSRGLAQHLKTLQKKYIVVVVGEPNTDENKLNLEVIECDDTDEGVAREFIIEEELKKKIPITNDEDLTLREILNDYLDTKINEDTFNELQTNDWPDGSTNTEFYRCPNDITIDEFTQNETGVVFESENTFYVYLGKEEKKAKRIVGLATTIGVAATGIGISALAVSGAAGVIAASNGTSAAIIASVGAATKAGVTTVGSAAVTAATAGYAVGWSESSIAQNAELGFFYEVKGVKKNTEDSEEISMSAEIKKALETKEYENCTLILGDQKPEDFAKEEKAKEILLDYETAFLGLDRTLLPYNLSRIFCLIDDGLDMGLDSSVKEFSQKWKETKKAAIKRDPSKGEKLKKFASLSQESIQGTISNLADDIKNTVTLQNKKSKVLGAVGAITAAVAAPVLIPGILLAGAIAAKHFKPGEPDDYLTMYVGTELAPQLQIFERKQLTVKTGTTGDLGLTYTKFVTEVLAPKAKGYLTSSELISLITSGDVSKYVKTGDNFKKFETELTLKGSSLNLDSILGQTIEGKIEADIAKLEAQMKQIGTQMLDVEGSTQTSQKKMKAFEQKKSEIEEETVAKKAEKTKFLDGKKTIEEDIQKVLVKYLNGEYSGKSRGGGATTETSKEGETIDKELIRALTDLLKSGEIAQKIKNHISKIIQHRVKITQVIEELKQINTQLEEVSPKRLSAVEQVSKGTHPIIYAKFVKAFGSEKGDKMFSKVFSSTIKRTMGAEENLATLFDENRKADLDRVLVDENTVTRAKLEELCNSYKVALAKKEEKKKKEAEAKKAREDKLKGLKATGDTSGESGDIDISGATSGISGLASSAYDKLSGLTNLMGAETEGKTSESLLDKAKMGLDLPDVKKTGSESYKPKDYKPDDLTTITKQELDDLREAEETLRKQLEMDRAIIKQYKQNIEHDISEHYKVLQLKEEQLLQKSEYVVKEQQKIVAYYMGVLQNRESILLEQERVLEMKRKKELQEIEELRISVQRGLVKELEKEKKYLLKHHNKQMLGQRSLLQEKLKDYKGDNLHLRNLLKKYHKDVPERRKGSLTHKKNKDSIVQESFMRSFVY